MGVTGLWKLVEPSGKPVPLETLENKVLAIDISIWLHQVVKGFQDNKGNTLAHAHLLGLFHRLCKLLYYRIKPVFIFDGGVPQLKRETIAKRNQSKNKILTEADRLQALLLQTLAKEKVVQQALGSTEDEIFKSPSKPKQPTLLQKPDKDEMFKLPELPSEERELSKGSTSASSCTKLDMSSCDSDSSLDEKNLRHAYAHNLQAVDVTSNQFKSLPADIRHEILTDIKETRKQSSWGRLHELPSESNEFSSFQMKRLLKRRQVQVCLEEAEKQMEGKSLTLNELRNFLSEEGVITSAVSTAAGTSRQIASDENTRYLLVRDLKKAIEAATKKEEEEKIQSSQELKHKITEIKNEKCSDDDEFDEDLQKAIQMSLECTDSRVYDDKDYECDDIKMNREQKRLLKDAAASLAKAYLIEYGGMNEDEIKEMLEQSQQSIESDPDADVDSFNFKYNDKFVLKGEICSPYRHMKTLLKNSEQMATNTTSNSDITVTNKPKEQRMEETEIKPVFNDNDFISSDSDDSDLVEVAEKIDPSPTKCVPKVDTNKFDRKLQINIDLNGEFNKEDDIFADIFENNTTVKTEKTEKSLKLTDIKRNENDVREQSVEKFNQNKSEVEVVSLVLNTEGEKILIEEDEMDLKNTQISNNIAETKIKQRTSINILDKLKKDLENVSKITLDDIKVEEKDVGSIERNFEIVEQKTDSHKEILDIPKITLDNVEIDTNLNLKKEIKNQSQPSSEPTEIIEILDDEDDTMNINKTPSKQKRKSISLYFETEYKIKRTPEKNQENDDELQTTPKVKKPFFVRKTPGSSERKRQEKLSNSDDDDEGSGVMPKRKKVSKMLFDDSVDSSNKNLNSEPVIENVLETAAKLLKENKTEKELHSIATDIAKQKRELELERNRQDRMGTSITDKMSYECMQLLKLFGVPYIVAPMEAEAQCAFLDAANLTDGTITDDSDIWLFGGKTVYKNFFNQQKHVLEFRVENIEKLFNVDRKKLIQLAILVGSDYTTGVNGVGTVTALEILATFPPTPPKDGETCEIVSILSSLRKFREWWRNGKTIGSCGKTALRGKLKNIELTEGFPNLQVVEAYLNPKVDFNREKFSWGVPDVETIREFAKKNFGWTKIKTDDILQPVLKKLSEKKMQLSIKNYFKVESVLSGRELKVSKRVQKAIDKLSLDPNQIDQSNDEAKKPKKSRVRKMATKTKTKSAEEHSDDIEENQVQPKKKKRQNKTKNTTNTTVASSEEVVIEESVASTSTTTVIPKSKPKLSRLLLPGAHETIPQKQRDVEEMRLRKKKAAEIFKKSETNKKQKKSVCK